MKAAFEADIRDALFLRRKQLNRVSNAHPVNELGERLFSPAFKIPAECYFIQARQDCNLYIYIFLEGRHNIFTGKQ